jgi:zinc and cadmium transporter
MSPHQSLDPGWAAITSVLVVSAVPLVGLAVLRVGRARLDRVVQHLVSFAVGALLGGAFLHLIPEAAGYHGAGVSMPLGVIGGFLGFFVLEKFFWVHHEHGRIAVKPLATLNLLGDGVHNLIDGMVIAAAYLADPNLGLVTTLAVILHEVPQEMGDFGVLVYAGFSPRRAVAFNLATGLTAVAGALAALVLGRYSETFVAGLLPVAAGGFIYIAASDLVPELHRVRTATGAIRQITLIVVGVMVMLLPHLAE